ncbi:hypothetical protein TcasGA2_TC014832 [Tribolium castaneum]|uniref:Uncharacterized protein n=1 Tax=Tribolium castaneum TaxID=7070 RepID=D2A4F7_TRICA|nr:hypothetical protein TcasGA2_TC014832 [Tribolium castaneum]
MQYLKTSVKDEAKRVIQPFQISEASYEAACVELNNRYNNKKLISTKLIMFRSGKRSRSQNTFMGTHHSVHPYKKIEFQNGRALRIRN